MQFRQVRNLIFHSLGIERTYKPRVMIERPEVGDCNQLEWAIAAQLHRNPNFRFLQIGAYDGLTRDALHDSICRYQLKGVLVEPQKAAFEKLQETYADQPQLTLVNAAIAEQSGSRTMYSMHGGASLLASFDKKHLLKHGVPADRIRAEEVQCMTADELLDLVGGRVDLIQIDAEGYDYEVLQMFDLAKLKPSLVRYERLHLTRRKQDLAASQLADLGYRLIVDRMDAMGYLDRAA